MEAPAPAPVSDGQGLAHWKLMWETWDLRSVILLSLFLQTFLIFSAPLRKRMSTAYITMPMWLSYLLADVTANFAVGLISKSQLDDSSGPFKNPDLLAFWAPFLLVHLGGPDTITAFALEDNELWLRHLLGLGFQCWAVAYSFSQSFPNKVLWRPTVIMFAAGLIKYTERTRALYLASSRRFRESLLKDPDPGPNYAKLMDEYTSKIEARLPTKIEMIPEPSRVNKVGSKPEELLTDLQMVQNAYEFFTTFKGLISDLIFSFRERNQSRDFFLVRTSRDAFKVVEVELNFIYEILYTKVAVVQGRLGIILRLLSFSLTCAAIVLFYFTEKKEIEKFDIGITYTLLVGAIALDIVASLMVARSDWTAVTLTKSENPNLFIQALQKVLRVDRVRFPENPGGKHRCCSWGWINQIVRRRWSESLSTYNLIRYCLHPRPKWWETTIEIFGLTKMLDGLKYVDTVDFTGELRDLIFAELKMKSELADDLETAKEIFSAKGDWVLRFESCTGLLRWINEVDFDEALLLWHIATELLYNTVEGKNHTATETDGVKATNKGNDQNTKTDGVPATNEGNDQNAKTNGGHSTNSGNDQKMGYRGLSKLLSDYMLYLLIMQATMLSTVAGIGEIRFRDTCAEAKKFFIGRKIEKSKRGKKCCLNIFTCGCCKCFCGSGLETGLPKSQKTSCSFKKCCSKEEKGPDKLQKLACDSILFVNTAVEPVAVKGDRSKSVLFDACMLAKELRKMEGTDSERMWKIIFKVWVEMLCYAACRCRANTHAANLSKGGQLISLVWLLMAHLGLGNQFQISEGHARAKLIVRK